MSAQVVYEAANHRAEIDTSSPFKSVKEAANLYGGFGFWKPSPHNHSQFEHEVINVSKLEGEAAELEKNVLSTERETLDLLKELENTKLIVQELKLKLQNEESNTREIEKQRISLEKTIEKVSSNTKTSSFGEMQKLSSETEEFEKMKEEARLEILKVNSEIERTKTRVKTAESRMMSAKKLEESARASEALALAEIAEIEASHEMSKKVEEVKEEVKASKKALEEAECQVETAKAGKLAAEQALRHRRIPELDRNPTLSVGRILSRKLRLTEDYESGTRKHTHGWKVSLGRILGGVHLSGKGDKEDKMPTKRKKFGLSRISCLAMKPFKK